VLSHRAIWDGIDALARRQGHSVSALAKLAGLDATAFNVSKRVSKDGRQRWPSTESIAKILDATGESFESFLAGTGAYFQNSSQRVDTTVPLLGLAQAGSGGFFDHAGFPAGQGWDEVALPTPTDSGLYALGTRWSRGIVRAIALWCRQPSRCVVATALWSKRARAR
jgi:phage repressor protein C with HTH and peptisase S24 domain